MNSHDQLTRRTTGRCAQTSCDVIETDLGALNFNTVLPTGALIDSPHHSLFCSFGGLNLRKIDSTHHRQNRCCLGCGVPVDALRLVLDEIAEVRLALTGLRHRPPDPVFPLIIRQFSRLSAQSCRVPGLLRPITGDTGRQYNVMLHCNHEQPWAALGNEERCVYYQRAISIAKIIQCITDRLEIITLVGCQRADDVL